MPVKAWKLRQHWKRYFQAKYHKTLDVEELLTVEDKNVPILVPYVRKFSFFCLVKGNPYLQHFPKVALLFQAEIHCNFWAQKVNKAYRTTAPISALTFSK